MSSQSHEVNENPEWMTRDPRQKDVYEAFLRQSTEQWTYLYRSWGDIGDFSGAQHSALLTKARAKSASGRTGWDLLIGSGGPGFSQSNLNGKWTTTYDRFSSGDVEPLIHSRDFHGVRPHSLELSEEFRLLFNLWEDRRDRTYYYFDDAGNAVKAAVITDASVSVLTSLIRRYQAVRQLYLALFIDSTLWSSSLPTDQAEWNHSDDSVNFAYHRDSSMGSGTFSRLLGKKILPPPKRKECGIWPFEPPRSYESFIIAVDDLGNEITHTSDPEKLANYFGKNPDSPHYLTPVFFRRDVLHKYYANPDMYSVEDGYVRCAGLWGLRLDNDLQDHVTVFLGDLGRDIPHSESQYWRSFNISPQDQVSETLIKRAFLAEFADPQSVDLRFARAYEETNSAWEARYSWTLFKPLHKDDAHVLAKLHIPLQDVQAEFDEQVGYLAKLLVDSLNETPMTATLGKGPKEEKGLAKLERFLTVEGLVDAATTLRPFANVQGLRSRGAAHRKGADFDLTVAIGELDRRQGFEKLLTEAVQTLDVLKNHASFAQNAETPVSTDANSQSADPS